MKSLPDVWTYLEETLVPSLAIQDSVLPDGQSGQFDSDNLLPDNAHFVIGAIRMRQLRTADGRGE